VGNTKNGKLSKGQRKEGRRKFALMSPGGLGLGRHGDSKRRGDGSEQRVESGIESVDSSCNCMGGSY